MAPEVIANHFGQYSPYDKRCDIFSYGIMGIQKICDCICTLLIGIADFLDVSYRLTSLGDLLLPGKEKHQGLVPNVRAFPTFSALTSDASVLSRVWIADPVLRDRYWRHFLPHAKRLAKPRFPPLPVAAPRVPQDSDAPRDHSVHAGAVTPPLPASGMRERQRCLAPLRRGG